MHNHCFFICLLVALILLFIIGATFVLIPRDVRIQFQTDEWKASLFSDTTNGVNQFYYDNDNNKFIIETEIPLLVENDNYVSISGQATGDIFYPPNLNEQVKIGTVTIDLDIPPRSSSTVFGKLNSAAPSSVDLALVSLQVIEDCSGCVLDSIGSKIYQIFGNDEPSEDICNQTATFLAEFVFYPKNKIISTLLDTININEEVEIGCKELIL